MDTTMGGLPQFITQAQFKQIYQQAQSQGLSDPAALAQTLVGHGHTLEGLNDQPSPNSLIGDNATGSNGSNTSTDEQPKSFLGKVGSAIGGIAKSVTQPFVAGIGSAVRSIEATPEVFKQFGNTDWSNIRGTQGETNPALDKMAQPIMGEKPLQGMNNKEALGTAAKVASYLVPAGQLGKFANPLSKLGPASMGAVIGGLQGGGDAAVNNKTNNEILGSIAIGAATGAIGGKIVSKLNGYFKGTNPNPENAINAYDDMFKQVNGTGSALGKQLEQNAAAISENDPSKILQLDTKSLETLSDLASRKGVQIPEDITSSNLTSGQTQRLFRELGTYYSPSDPFNEVTAFKNQLAKKATSAFGDEWTSAYQNYGEGINVVRRLGNMLENSDKVTPQEATSAFKDFGKLANDPFGKVYLQKSMEDYASMFNHDLSDPTKLIAQATKVKNPVVKKALMGSLELLGLTKIGGLINHFIP